jgi:hypothetical protein
MTIRQIVIQITNRRLKTFTFFSGGAPTRRKTL